MSYCRNCGLEIETFDCPICGYKNYEAKKPVEAKLPEQTKTNNVHPGHTNNAHPGHSNNVHSEHSKNARSEHSNCARNSSHMLAGGIGSFMIALSAIILGILPIYGMMQEGWMRFESFGIYLLFIIATITFMAGAFILIGGLYGMFKHYGSYQGLVALIFSIVSPLILLVFTLIAIGEETHSYSSYYNSYSYSNYVIGTELWIGHLFIGIMFILIGISWRNIYFRVGLDQPNVPVGSMFILAGVLFMVMFGFTGIPWIIISVAGFSASVLFMLARSGTENIPYGRPKYIPHWMAISDLPPPPKY